MRRIDYYILALLERKSIVSMDVALTAREIESEIVKTYKSTYDRFAIYRTIMSRLHWLKENEYICNGFRSQVKNHVIDTWLITYKGIELVKQLEEENNEVLSVEC